MNTNKMAAPMENTLENICSDVFSILDRPEEFLTVHKGHAYKFSHAVKKLYDSSKTSDVGQLKSTNALSELIIKGFDDEQVWQQIELENGGCVQTLLGLSAKLLSSKTLCSFRSKPKSSAAPDIGKTLLKESSKKSKTRKQMFKKIDNDSEDDIENDEIIENAGDETIDDEGGSDIEDSDIELQGHSDEKVADEEDKFFDFTGDSDDDLNYDFGPLGSKGDLLFDKDQNDDESDAENYNEEKSEPQSKTKKKSVTFEDEQQSADKSRKAPKSPLLKQFHQDRGFQSKRTGSIVDDAFFKLADLEAFLEQEDKREERRILREQKGYKRENTEDDDLDNENDQEEIDMFGEIDSEDEGLHYEDFFDPPDGEVERNTDDRNDVIASDDDENDDKEEDDDDGSGDIDEDNTSEDPEAIMARRALQRDLLADSDSEGEEVTDILGGGSKEQKSSYELRQEKLKKKISEMEGSMLSDKPWQMAGEVNAGKRPENSLLQENLQFDYTTRLPPEITEVTTKSLEDIIKQRVKDKAWDDVERKVKPKENPYEYKKRITLDQEKSKKSLGEIYEQEYLKQQQSEEVEKKDPDHDEIKKMMTSLFVKLDALSNFHYTPKQAAPEVQIISNQPSIAMEEVAPVAVSDAKLLAPEEVQDKVIGEVKGATEKTKVDKLRERQKKKKKNRIRQKEKEQRQKVVEKLNPGLGNKYSKEKVLQRLEKESKGDKSGLTLLKDDKKEKSGLTSSRAFFTQLQEEVTSHVKTKAAEKRKQKTQINKSGKKFKL